MRYNNVNVGIKQNKGAVYLSNVLPHLNPVDSDIMIITSAEDRLDLLANQFYNDSRLWWIIAQANNLNGVNIGVEAGIQLRIPKDKFLIINNL